MRNASTREDELAKRPVGALCAKLGANVHACIQYGSTVRGDASPGVSDINLLLVLNQSTPDAHAAVAKILRDHPRIDPMRMARSRAASRPSPSNSSASTAIIVSSTATTRSRIWPSIPTTNVFSASKPCATCGYAWSIASRASATTDAASPLIFATSRHPCSLIFPRFCG